ncbi:MAG: hypothetical protein JXA30_18950 [Deltaproteobacteria bacterium]|nr:hypothetical protein [Deltaproteobacteria bacterium]
MSINLHRLYTLFLLSVFLFACGDRDRIGVWLDATVEASVNSPGSAGISGYGSAGTSSAASTTGESALPTGAAGINSENNAINATADAAIVMDNSESGAGTVALDAAEQEAGESSRKPDWAGCPGRQPEPEKECHIEPDIVCTYGDITCSCQALFWVCSETQIVLDAGDTALATDSEASTEQEGEGPKNGPRSEGGTRGPQRGSREAGGSKDGGE